MYVIADTDKDNIPSHKVLEKLGAEMYKETDELYFWRFSRNPFTEKNNEESSFYSNGSSLRHQYNVD